MRYFRIGFFPAPVPVGLDQQAPTTGTAGVPPNAIYFFSGAQQSRSRPPDGTCLFRRGHRQRLVQGSAFCCVEGAGGTPAVPGWRSASNRCHPTEETCLGVDFEKSKWHWASRRRSLEDSLPF